MIQRALILSPQGLILLDPIRRGLLMIVPEHQVLMILVILHILTTLMIVHTQDLMGLSLEVVMIRDQGDQENRDRGDQNQENRDQENRDATKSFMNHLF
jgi:hypothetical protein